MLKFHFAAAKKKTLRILCVGAHSDDIEIGCGGTILRLLSEYADVEVHWIIFGSNGQRNSEATASARNFLSGAKRKKIVVKNFKDSYFPYRAEKMKKYFTALSKRISPDVIFTHYRHDLHQDHRLISELTWNAYRNHLILEYEIVKYDGDLGLPNFFVHIDKALCRKKVDFIMDSFKSQREKDWFTPDAFFSILRLRGIESRAPGRYAEGFYCRKLVV